MSLIFCYFLKIINEINILNRKEKKKIEANLSSSLMGMWRNNPNNSALYKSVGVAKRRRNRASTKRAEEARGAKE